VVLLHLTSVNAVHFPLEQTLPEGQGDAGQLIEELMHIPPVHENPDGHGTVSLHDIESWLTQKPPEQLLPGRHSVPSGHCIGSEHRPFKHPEPDGHGAEVQSR
jgi:hypothetical protein